ncbi:hypothetical protein [Streptosporangium sp. CA-115845]
MTTPSAGVKDRCSGAALALPLRRRHPVGEDQQELLSRLPRWFGAAVG